MVDLILNMLNRAGARVLVPWAKRNVALSLEALWGDTGGYGITPR